MNAPADEPHWEQQPVARKRETGVPLVQMNVRIPADCRDAIAARAERIGISRDEWIRRAIAYTLDRTAAARPATYRPVQDGPPRRR